MFGRKPKKDARQLGAEVVHGVKNVWDSFEKTYVVPLQRSLLDKFSELLDSVVDQFGIDPNLIRNEFRSLSNAWDAGLLQMKPQLLEFEDMEIWLECAEVAKSRSDILDWLDEQFEEYTLNLRIMATGMVGGRVLTYGLGDSSNQDS